jgi:hypothetical protein
MWDAGEAGAEGKTQKQETPKTHPSENPAERGKPLGRGTLKFRYARAALGNH